MTDHRDPVIREAIASLALASRPAPSLDEIAVDSQPANGGARSRGFVVAVAVAALVLAVIGTLSLLFGGSEGSVPPADTEPTIEVERRSLGGYSDPQSGFGRDGIHLPEMDVYAPAGGGPYPIVVVLHADPALHTKNSTAELAGRIAETGAVVFNPTWGGTGRTEWDLDLMAGQGGCALQYAAAHGPEYGGDPHDARVVGIGLGANAALLSQSGSGWSVDCLTDPAYAEVTQIIGLNGDYTLSPVWDAALSSWEGIYSQSTAWSALFHQSQYPPPAYDIIIDTATAAAYGDTETYFDLRHLRFDGVDLGARSPIGFDLRTAWENYRAALVDYETVDTDEITLRQVNEIMHDHLASLDLPVTFTAVTGTGDGLSGPSIDAIVAKIRDRWDIEASLLAIVDGFTAAVNRYDTQAIRRLVTDNFMDYEGDRRTDRGWTLDLDAFLGYIHPDIRGPRLYYQGYGLGHEPGDDRSVTIDNGEYVVEEAVRIVWPETLATWNDDNKMHFVEYLAEVTGTMTYHLVETDNGWRIRTRHWVEDPGVIFGGWVEDPFDD